jgi:hypothetical protein
VEADLLVVQDAAQLIHPKRGKLTQLRERLRHEQRNTGCACDARVGSLQSPRQNFTPPPLLHRQHSLALENSHRATNGGTADLKLTRQAALSGQHTLPAAGAYSFE